MKRIKYEELRKVGGFDVVVKYIESLNYSGVWESDGYEIYLALKKIGTYWGYPVNEDIQKLLDKETSV